MRLGNTEIKNGLCLSPMAGFTDLPMRRQCRRFGAEYTVTEMVSAAALCYGDLKTADLAYLTEDDAPCAIQLFGHDPDQMARAVTLMASGEYAGSRSHVPPAAMDLNMGCPVKKIVSGGDGSALMRSPESVRDLTYAAVRAAEKYHVPVTVKIRAGWDSDHKNAVEIARTAVSAGAAAVCVHGRTREQMYRPGVDLDVIAAVRDALPADTRINMRISPTRLSAASPDEIRAELAAYREILPGERLSVSCAGIGDTVTDEQVCVFLDACRKFFS